MRGVLQMHTEAGLKGTTDRVKSCAKDEGRHLGIGFQEQIPNQSKLLRSKRRGGERWIKSPNEIWAGEHSRDEREQTLGDASKGFRHCQNRRRSHPLG